MEPQKIHKIILLGDTSTGKSAFLRNYISNDKPRVLRPTEGFECLTAVTTNPLRWIQIWDTPGQEKYRMMPQSIIGGFNFAVVFYDVTNHHTFKVAEQTIKNISMYNPQIQLTLIGNKIDIVANNPGRRQVQTKEGYNLAQDMKANFTELSFDERADNLVNRLFSTKFCEFTEPGSSSIRLENESQRQAQCRTCI